MSGSMTCAPSDCGLTCTDPDSPVACPAHGSTAARCQSAGDRSATQYLPPVLRGGRVGRCPRRRLGGWKAMASPFTGTGRRGRSSLAVRANGWRPRGAPHRTTCWAAGSHGADHPLGRDRRATVRAARRRPSTASGGPRPTTSGPSATRACIIHWDGAAWSRVLSGTSYDLVDVWGSGPSDVWATGYAGSTAAGVIVHWDGTSWSPVPEGAPFGAEAVGGSGPNDAWVVGGGAIVHWNGSAWSTVPSPTAGSLRDVWAMGPADAWIVGGGGTLLHWNGAAWSVVPNPHVRQPRGCLVQRTKRWLGRRRQGPALGRRRLVGRSRRGSQGMVAPLHPQARVRRRRDRRHAGGRLQRHLRHPQGETVAGGLLRRAQRSTTWRTATARSARTRSSSDDAPRSLVHRSATTPRELASSAGRDLHRRPSSPAAATAAVTLRG